MIGPAPVSHGIRLAPRPPGVKARAAAVRELRRRGVRGGVIPQHRAMAGLAATPMVAVNALAIPLVLAVGLMYVLPTITELWGTLFRLLAAPLGFQGPVLARVVTVGDVYALAIPYVDVAAAWPTGRALTIGAVATVVVLAATFALPPAFTPARYALRALVAVQTVATGYFAFATPPYPYRLPDYLIGFMSTAAAVLVLTPLLLGATFFLFQLALWRKLLLAVLLVAHLAVLFPLQALVHAYLIVHGTLLVMPVLFLVFGLLVESFVFVAFYGWGMSWTGRTVAP